jgi:sterol desaturase/sphingolipid hydroxylase (fatty acid hydroxylase superfamily)
VLDRAALAAQIRREIRASAVTSALFAGAGLGILLAWESGLFPLSLDFASYGWPRALATGLFLVFAHETYFYFTHRWMHQPRVFAQIHRLHHESRRPTPFAAFAFHPGEGLIQAAALPLLLAFVPVHPFVLIPFLLFMTVTGTLNHLGFELYPRGFASHPFWKYWISATHHQAHHERVSGNYGLYFTFWDRWLGTERPGYEAAYDAVHARRTPSLSARSV